MCCECKVEQNDWYSKGLKKNIKLTYGLMQIYGAMEELEDIQTDKMKTLFEELISEIRRCRSEVL